MGSGGRRGSRRGSGGRRRVRRRPGGEERWRRRGIRWPAPAPAR